MKKYQLEVWSTFDKLCLMSAITKLKTSFADQNWVAISRYTKQLHENTSSFIQYDNRSDEWFSAKQCSAQYEVLIKGSGSRKKKKVDRNFDYSDVHEALLLSINQEFCEELQMSLIDIREDYLQTKQQNEDLDSDKIEEDRLEELIWELVEKEKVSDIKTKLKSMLDEKNAADSESNTKYLSQTLLPNEPSTSTEHKAANITTSPLLTSLLQSPSPLVRPSPSTSSPTISLLLHSSPSVSLTDPTLSKLLETPTPLPGTPTSLPGTSTIAAIETPFLFQGAILDPQQTPSETKKNQSDGGEEVSVQRVISDPVEYQRTEGFDDMSDIEQGVVESEVIIENESSPIKRLTPRRLDLENIGDEEPEEEILETVEEIIERVEEAIIETVGENNLNELVLNEGIDTVSISDEEIENINIEDNTYEVIVVGSHEETVPSSSEVSDGTIVIEESLTKRDKIDVTINEMAKNPEMLTVDDQVESEDDIPKSVNHQNIDVGNEVSLKENDESCVEKDGKKNSDVNIVDRIDQEVSNKSIVLQEKSSENIVDSVDDKTVEKQSENDNRSSDLDKDSEHSFKDESVGVDNSIISITSPGHNTELSTSEDVDHSIAEVIIDKHDQETNQCQQIPVGTESVPNIEEVEDVSSLDNQNDKPIEKKLSEELEFTMDENEVEVKSHDEVDKALNTEISSNEIEVHNDNANNVSEIKDDLTNIPGKNSEENGVKEKLTFPNEEVLEKCLNTEKSNEEAPNIDEIAAVVGVQQSATIETSADEKELVISDTVVKENDPSIEGEIKPGLKPEKEKLVETKESCKDQVTNIDPNSEKPAESVPISKEMESTTPLLNPDMSEESELNVEQHEKEENTGKPIEHNLIEGIPHSEDEQVNINTNNTLEKDEEIESDIDNTKEKPSIIEDEKKAEVDNLEISSIGIPEESHKAPEIVDTKKADEVQETLKAKDTLEAQGTQEVLETQETPEVRETPGTQEPHDVFDERVPGPIFVESDESKSDSTEEILTEDNSILTTEDSKDGLDDSLKFSSLETLSMPSVDSPPEFNDPKFARLTSKEKEFRSLIGKGFEELKNKAAELVFIPFEDKPGTKKQAKPKNRARTKKEKSFKTKKMTEKANWDKSSDQRTPKEKPSKDRSSNKDKANNEKYANSGRKSKYLSSLDAKPDSPSLSTTSSDEDRDYKSWKKSILLVYNRLASHKYASVFSKPITENEAPSYHQIILRPMDLSTIKRNIENGVIRTTVEFQRDMLLMVQNAIIYNKFDTPVYDMAKAMGEDMLAQMEVMVQALGDGVPLIGDTSEEKQITRARTSKSSVDTPQAKKRKTQEPEDIRPKRNKLSMPC